MKKLLNAAENKQGGKLFNFRPVLFAAAFFALGIGFAYARLFQNVSFWWLLFALPVLFLPPFLSENAPKAFLCSVVLLLFFSVGCLSFSCEIRSFRSVEYHEGECTVVGTVTEKYDYKEYSRAVLSDILLDGKRVDGKLVAYLDISLSNEMTLADRVVVVGRIGTETTPIGRYGLRSKEISQRIRYRFSVSSLAVSGRSSDVFLLFRDRMEKRIYAGMDVESAAVTCALLTGDDSGIEEGLLANIRYGGIAHIFAVSGLHIGAIYVFCRFLVDKTRLGKFPKVVRFLFSAAVILFYAGVCGFSPSVVRASLMCLALYASSLIGVKRDSLETIGGAALLLLFIHPVYLFDVGFRLSFAASFSVGAFAPFLRNLLDRAFFRFFPEKADSETSSDGVIKRGRRAVFSFLSVTLSVQIGTIPVLLNAFGYVSVWGLLLNCIFVPVVGAVYSVLSGLVLLSCLLPASAAPVLLYFPSVFWSAVLLLFHAADFSFVLYGTLAGRAAVLWYSFFAVCSDKLNLSFREKCLLLVLLFSAFAATLYSINV